MGRNAFLLWDEATLPHPSTSAGCVPLLGALGRLWTMHVLQLELPEAVVATTAPCQPRRWLQATRRQQLEPCWARGDAPEHPVPVGWQQGGATFVGGWGLQRWHKSWSLGE